MPNCIVCGAPLVWQSDFDYEDYGLEGEGYVTVWTCSACGAEHEVYVNCGEEETG